MKKISLSLLLLFNSIAIFAQFTAIPDANFEAYLEDNGMGDGVPSNGQVLTANINTVTILPVSAMNIADLTGIEDFIALEELGCAFNDIINLNLSNNLKLRTLFCLSTGLTSLILPASPDLSIIVCGENFLTELDVSQNPNLRELDCNINGLTTLDISQNPNLEYLRLSNNSITGVFDTSQNINLESLSISNNNLTNLDLSQNINLLSLIASNNPLQDLDIRNGFNENIGNFIVVSEGLECILVDDSSAPYLDNWLKDPETQYADNQQECDELLSIESDLETRFSMYPNPARKHITISTPMELKYRLLSLQGAVLKNGSFNNGVNFLSVSGLAKGVYILSMQSGETYLTKKLLID